MSDDLLLVERNGYVVTLTINRPEKRNALNPEIHAALVSGAGVVWSADCVRCRVGHRRDNTGVSCGHRRPKSARNRDVISLEIRSK